MRMRPAVFSILLLVTLVPIVGDAAASSRPDTANEILRRYADAFNNRSASDLAALYAEDACLLPPGRPLIRGRREIERDWRRLRAFERGTLRLPSVVSRDFGETTGYLVGYFSYGSFRESDRAPAADAKFVLCVKRTPEGEWLIAADIWNEASVFQFAPTERR